MFGQKKGFSLNSITKAGASLGFTPNVLKKAIGGYGSQLAGAAKAGLNARVARTAAGLQTKITGAPPTPTPIKIQNAKPMTPPGATF
jgi:ribosomal protein L13E